MGGFEHRNTAKNIAEHRITERKVDGTPSAQYIVLATPRLVFGGTCLLSFTIEKTHLTKLKNKRAALVHLK